jgi:hypothetical protein
MKKLGTKARFYYLLQWRTLEFSLSFSSLRRGWILIFGSLRKEYKKKEKGETSFFEEVATPQGPRKP